MTPTHATTSQSDQQYVLPEERILCRSVDALQHPFSARLTDALPASIADCTWLVERYFTHVAWDWQGELHNIAVRSHLTNQFMLYLNLP